MDRRGSLCGIMRSTRATALRTSARRAGARRERQVRRLRSRGHYTQNQFGAALGGPVIKDRIFFEGAYEGWRYSKPTLTTTLVPTSQELAGDFSSVATSYYQHKFYNPYSTVCTGGSCTVQQFQCDANGMRCRRRTTSRQRGRLA